MRTAKRLNFVAFSTLILLSLSLRPAAANETIDELYKKALKEEGVVNC